MSQIIAKTSKQCFPRISSILNSSAIRMSSASTHANPNPHGWKSWRDIPDSAVPTTSQRDPNNKVYSSRKYINLRKQQIWMQIPDDVPVYVKNGVVDKTLYYGVIVALVSLLAFNGYYILDMMFGGPKKK